MFPHLVGAPGAGGTAPALLLIPIFFFRLTEITFSFCRLFEKRPTQFLPEMVAAMKGNSTLKGLRLPGNRLGGNQTLEREGGRNQAFDYKLLG